MKKSVLLIVFATLFVGHTFAQTSFKFGDLYYKTYQVTSNNTLEVQVTYSNEMHSTTNYSGLANKNITIPRTVTYSGHNYLVTSIDQYAFENSKISSITIPEGVLYIYTGAFMNCKNLKSITLGSGVTKISSKAFNGCSSLESIDCKSVTPPIVVDDKLTGDGLQDAMLYLNVTFSYPEESSKLYRKMQPWCNFDTEDDNVVVKDTVFVYDTVYSVINTRDTIYNIVNRIDTIYNIINTRDTIFSVVTKVDTVYSVISSKDTVYLAENSGRYQISAKSANTKMGIVYGSGIFANGSTTEIVAIEKYGYHFTKWSDGNTENPRFVEVNGDDTFTAEFEVNNYSVFAEANAVAMGKVEGGAEYAYLSRTQLKAIPNEGYEFKEWSDGETANPRNILVYSDTSFTAVFVALETTTVAESAANAINIYTAGKTIVVENATDEIRVYDAMGKLVCRNAANRNNNKINVKTSGIYIVKIGSAVKRVVVN